MGGSILVEATDEGDDALTMRDAFGMATLSEDGSTLTWKLTSDRYQYGRHSPMTEGFDLVISGIRANASSRGRWSRDRRGH